jgi:hypothetical protein
MRGLEWKMSMYAAEQLAGRRASVIEAMLAEQYRQEDDGFIDPCRIAFASSQLTYLCRIEARERATQDALYSSNMEEEESQNPRKHKKAKIHEEDKSRSPVRKSPSPTASFISTWQTLLQQISSSMSLDRTE